MVDAGSVVRHGQLLAEIDPTEINSQVAQIVAQLDGAQARLEQARRAEKLQKEQTVEGIRQAEEALETARARLKVAELNSATQPELTSSAIKQADANLKTSRDNLELLRNSTHPQAVVQAQSGFEDAKAAEDNARRNLQRQEKLFERGFVSQQLVDSARAELAAMTARLQQARKRLDLIETQNRLEEAAAVGNVRQNEAALQTARANSSQLRITSQELEVARSSVRQALSQLAAAKANRRQDQMRGDDVSQAQASLVQIQNQLNEYRVRQGDTTLVAPMAGVVTKRYIEEGELVTSGVSSFSSGTPVLQIADLSRMLVKMSVNEVDVYKVRAGAPVEITIDAAKGVTFYGRVTKVAPAAAGAATASDQNQQAQRGTGSVVTFPVEVTVDRPDPRLKPGMSARCAIIIGRRKNVIRIPKDNVPPKGDSATVQVVTQGMKDGKKTDVFTDRKVKVGLRGDTFTEVTEGLKEGERIKPAPYTGPKRKEMEMNFD
jgi:HlyD family secretion protein